MTNPGLEERIISIINGHRRVVEESMALNFEVRDRIAYFSFSRPEKHNALRDEDLFDLIRAFQSALISMSQPMSVFSFGEGRSFSSGADISDRLQRSDRRRR